MRDELGSEAVLRLSVRAVQQMSGSFQHVTIYDADVELCESGFEVEITGVKVASAMPMEPAPDDVEAARLAILEGVREVLEPLGRGARVRVRHVILHPVDFQSQQFRRYTALKLAELLAEAGDGQD